MESQPENIKKMQPNAGLFSNIGKERFFFFHLLSCKSVNLLFAAKTNKLKDEDVYHIQSHKEGVI